jgi:hypothetical protein
MGDHRSDSTDSRVFGFIARDDIIGRAVVRYWPLSTFKILQTPTYPGVPTAEDDSVGGLARPVGPVVPAGLRARLDPRRSHALAS